MSNEFFVESGYVRQYVSPRGNTIPPERLDGDPESTEQLLDLSFGTLETDSRSVKQISNTIRSIASKHWGEQQEERIFKSLEVLVENNPIAEAIISKATGLTKNLPLPVGVTEQDRKIATRRVFVLALEDHLAKEWLNHDDPAGSDTEIAALFRKGIQPKEQQEILSEMLDLEMFRLSAQIILRSRYETIDQEKIARIKRYDVSNAFAELMSRVVADQITKNNKSGVDVHSPDLREVNRRVVLATICATNRPTSESGDQFPGFLMESKPMTWANHLYVKNFAFLHGLDPRNIELIETELQKINKSMFWIYCADGTGNEKTDDPYKQHSIRAQSTVRETAHAQFMKFIRHKIKATELPPYYDCMQMTGSLYDWENAPDKRLLLASDSPLIINKK